jgi:hypothetical protein
VRDVDAYGMLASNLQLGPHTVSFVNDSNLQTLFVAVLNHGQEDWAAAALSKQSPDTDINLWAERLSLLHFSQDQGSSILFR